MYENSWESYIKNNPSWRGVNILGDFGEYEKEVAIGKISAETYYDNIFPKARRNGLDNSVYPFAIGGSECAIIMGVDEFGHTPRGLAMLKTGMRKETPNEKTKWAFLRGHLFEDPIRQMFAKKTGLQVDTFTLQVQHKDFPHCVANIDGIVWLKGKPAIYEGKTTHNYFKNKTIELFKANKVPINYYYQVQFYMEVLDLDLAVINCAWGFDPYQEMAHVWIKRDRSLGVQIMEECERFIDFIKKGRLPDNRNVKDRNTIFDEANCIYGKINDSLPSVHLGSDKEGLFKEYYRLEDEINALKEDLKPFEIEENTLKEKYSVKEKEKAIKELQEEQERLACFFVDDLKNHPKGFLTVGNITYRITMTPKENPIFDSEVKKYFREKYPKVWDDVMSFKPQKGRKVIYERERN